MPVYTEVSLAIEDALYNTISAAAQAGGLLATVKNVERATPPEKNIFPSVGVAFDEDVSERVPIGGRRYEATLRYWIVVAAQMPFSEAQPDTIEAARLALRNLIDDGNGNGMSPLLDADPTLGGLCTLAWVASLKVAPLKANDASAGTIAAAIYRFHTKTMTR